LRLRGLLRAGGGACAGQGEAGEKAAAGQDHGMEVRDGKTLVRRDDVRIKAKLGDLARLSLQLQPSTLSHEIG
jgi:hypothetical protein